MDENLDDATDTTTAEDIEEEITEETVIEDEETPLDNTDANAGKRVWWSWLPIIGAGLSTYEGIKEKRKAKKDENNEK